MAWACCKNEWRKDAKKLPKGKPEREIKKEDLDTVDVELGLRIVCLKSWRTGVMDRTGA